MGSGASTEQDPSRYPVTNHEELYKRTEGYRTLISDIFNFMMYQLNVNDFLSLSTPTGCKKYVLFMANNLQYFFHQMRVDVQSNKQGILAFQRADTLQNPTGDAGTEKQTLCLVLAYYYTRIFQIYGALALTLMDDISYLQSPAAAQLRRLTMGSTQYLMNPPPGHQREVLTVDASRMKQFGGFAGVDLGNFEFLSDFLTDNRQSKGFVTKYRTNYAGNDAVIFFKPSSDEHGRIQNIRDATRKQSNYQTGVFSILIQKDSPLYSTLEITARRVEGTTNTIAVGLSKLVYRKKGAPFDSYEYNVVRMIGSDDVTLANFTVTSTVDATNRTVYTITEAHLSLFDYFTKLFYKLIPKLKKSITGESGEESSEMGVIDELKLSGIKTAMLSRPMGTCIARSAQLLSSLQKDAMGMEFFTSSVCTAKFFKGPGKNGEGERKGMPKPGESITGSATTFRFALSQFADTVVFGSPRLGVSQESAALYKTMYLKMLALMEGMQKAQTVAPAVMASVDPVKDFPFDAIRNVRDSKKGYCAHHEDKMIRLTKEQGESVQPYVIALLQRQLAHAQACGEIFQELFYHNRRGNMVEIALSDNIQRGGIPEINRINAKARDLLMNYYIDCESTYQQGMKQVITLSEKAAPPPAPLLGRSISAPLAQQAQGRLAKAQQAQGRLELEQRARQALQGKRLPNAPRGGTRKVRR